MRIGQILWIFYQWPIIECVPIFFPQTLKSFSNQSYKLTGYIGSALGGYTYDIMGFENSTLVVIAMQIMALMAIFGLICKPKTTKLEVTDEKQALLGGRSNSRKSDQNANYQSFETV